MQVWPRHLIRARKAVTKTVFCYYRILVRVFIELKYCVFMYVQVHLCVQTFLDMYVNVC